MINKKEVVHIAKLARLKLSESELEKMQKDLSSILDYFEILKTAKKPLGAPTPQYPPTPQYLDVGKIARRDEIIPKNSSLANNLIAAAPEKKDGYIKVKQIL